VSCGGRAGTAQGLPMHPLQEEQMKHEMKPGETRILQRPHLRAFICLCWLYCYLVLLGITPRHPIDLIENINKQKKTHCPEENYRKFKHHNPAI